MGNGGRTLYVVQSARMYGSQRSLMDMLVGLRGSAVDPIVAIRETGPLTDELKRLGVPVHVVQLRNWLNNRDAFQSWRKQVLNRIYGNKLAHFARIQRVDLIHTNTFIVPIGAMAAKRLEIPHVWHAREELQPKRGRIFVKPDHQVRAFVKHTTQSVLTPSKTNLPWLKSFVPEDMVQVVPNGPLDESNKAPFILKPPIINRPAKIAVIGRLGKAKGTEDAIQAAALLKKGGASTTWTFVGSGQDGYSQELEKLACDLEVSGDVQFVGFENDVSPYFQDADIVVMPSHAETFGRVTAEALGYGCPIVASKLPATCEIVEDGQTGILFPVGDAQSMADGIAKLLSNQDLRECLARKGYDEAWSRFTRQKLGERIADVYKSAL